MPTPPGKNSSSPLLIIAVLAVAGIALGFMVGKVVDEKRSANLMLDIPGVTVLPEPRLLVPIKLVDHNGQAFSNEQLAGKWTFVFFGYTHCPDVCPNTMTLFNVIANGLAEDPALADKMRFLFVSVDPDRDTPEILANYMAYFNKQFVGVTGTHDELQKLTRQVGVVYIPILDPQSPGNYTVDHSASIILLSPKGEYFAVFSAPHKAQTMMDAFRSIVMR